MNKLIMLLAVIMLVLAGATNILAKDGGSGENSGSGRDENRVRVEIRGDDIDAGTVLSLVNSLVASEDNSRIRVEIRGLDDEAEEAGLEVNGDTFEITGMVTDFTGDTVTVDGTTIIINPSLVADFEQEGTIEVGETIKVEGMVAPDGSFLVREIEANGVEDEDGHGS